MNRIHLLVALLVYANVFQAQQPAKEVIELAENIDFGKIFDPQIDIEQYSYIPEDKGNYGIMSIDGNPMLRGGLIPSGTHMLQLHYEDFNYNSARSVRMISELRQFDFEAGKSYHYARRKSEKYELVIEEDTLSRMEYIKSFKTCPEANPNLLEGTWNGEMKHAMMTYYMQCRVTGNRMAFESRSGKRVFVAEGQIYYNENTIVLMPDKATYNGNEVKNFGLKPRVKDLNKQPKYIWYYTLTDGTLQIESNRKFQTKSLMWDNDGEFHKIKQ